VENWVVVTATDCSAMDWQFPYSVGELVAAAFAVTICCAPFVAGAVSVSKHIFLCQRS